MRTPFFFGQTRVHGALGQGRFRFALVAHGAFNPRWFLGVFGTWEASGMGARCLHPPVERKCALESRTCRGEQFLAYSVRLATENPLTAETHPR
jgi:hypothetical protein